MLLQARLWGKLQPTLAPSTTWQEPLLRSNGLAGLTCLLAAKSKVRVSMTKMFEFVGPQGWGLEAFSGCIDNYLRLFSGGFYWDGEQKNGVQLVQMKSVMLNSHPICFWWSTLTTWFIHPTDATKNYQKTHFTPVHLGIERCTWHASSDFHLGMGIDLFFFLVF